MQVPRIIIRHIDDVMIKSETENQARTDWHTLATHDEQRWVDKFNENPKASPDGEIHQNRQGRSYPWHSTGESQKLAGAWEVLSFSEDQKVTFHEKYEWWNLHFFMKGGFCGHQVNPHRCFSSYDEDRGSKLIQKAREAPCVLIGMAGFATITVHVLYKSKSRANTKMLSVHLIHMCLAAQGFAVGVMTLAMG